jgi:hypothetical protein
MAALWMWLITHGLHRERKLKCSFAKMHEPFFSWGHIKCSQNFEVTTKKRLDQGFIQKLISIPRQTCLGRESTANELAGPMLI